LQGLQEQGDSHLHPPVTPHLQLGWQLQGAHLQLAGALASIERSKVISLKSLSFFFSCV